MRLSAFTCFMFLFGIKAHSQRVFEVSIKPTEFVFLNFETSLSIGNTKRQYGLLFSFRPSTQDSGQVRAIGSGACYCGYGDRVVNKLYTAYTLGLFHKVYIRDFKNFLETDIFFRIWHFDQKPAAFGSKGYEFQGLRTDNVDVLGLKLLYGTTVLLTKKDRNIKPYLDVYVGAGIRYQEETFETFNGIVNGTFYSYLKEKNYRIRPSPQLGIKLGIVKTK